MTSSAELTLFDLPPAPKRQQKHSAGPAYRPSRQAAERYRDELLAEARDHQRGCQQCMAAANVPADARPIDACCVIGHMRFYRAGVIESGLRAGYYPDQQPPAAQPAASQAEEILLW